MPAPDPLNKATLRSNAATRLNDAQILFDNQRYDGAAYLCGYAVEFALKARICETLNTTVYPDHIAGFKVHRLDLLLFLTGRESHIRQSVLVEWSFVVERWQPEMRYKPTGNISPADVQTLLDATKRLLQLL